jgi:hypothetical protein
LQLFETVLLLHYKQNTDRWPRFGLDFQSYFVLKPTFFITPDSYTPHRKRGQHHPSVCPLNE